MLAVVAVAVRGTPPTCGTLFPSLYTPPPSALPCLCYDASNCSTGKIYDGKSLCSLDGGECKYVFDPQRPCSTLVGAPDVIEPTTTDGWWKATQVYTRNGTRVAIKPDCGNNPQCISVTDTSGSSQCFDLTSSCAGVTGVYASQRCAQTPGCDFVSGLCVATEVPCSDFTASGSCEQRDCVWQGSSCANRQPPSQASEPAAWPAITIVSIMGAVFFINIYEACRPGRRKNSPDSAPPKLPPKYSEANFTSISIQM